MTDFDTPHLIEKDGAVRLPIRVVLRAGRNALDGVTEAGALRIRLAAPPVEGAANVALIAFLADLLGVPKRNVIIVRGERGRDKMIEIAAPITFIQEQLRVATDRRRPE